MHNVTYLVGYEMGPCYYIPHTKLTVRVFVQILFYGSDNEMLDDDTAADNEYMWTKLGTSLRTATS